jgi:hypothetical protein
MQFLIEARDAYGNLRPLSTAETFTVTLTGASTGTVYTPTITSNNNGTYTVTQTMVTVDTYTLAV